MLDPVYWTVLAVSTIAAAVAFWTLKFQEFHGKIYYALTFLGMIWTLMMVGAEAATPAYACQMQQAQLAWLGHGLVPVAWSFFIFEYVGPSSRSRGWVSLLALIAVPLAAFGLAATNDWHHLIYTAETALQPGDDQITFAHGPGYLLRDGDAHLAGPGVLSRETGRLAAADDAGGDHADPLGRERGLCAAWFYCRRP
jgi:hypothetical protein